MGVEPTQSFGIQPSIVFSLIPALAGRSVVLLQPPPRFKPCEPARFSLMNSLKARKAGYEEFTIYSIFGLDSVSGTG